MGLVLTALLGCSSTNESGPTPPGGTGTTNPTEPGPVGSGCTEDTQCVEGNVCLNGACTMLDCKSDTCPAGTACMLVDEANTRACLKSCEDASECAEGQVCADAKVCTPKCTEESCVTGTACDAESGLCVADVSVLPAPPYPQPTCDDVPSFACEDGAKECAKVEAFEPVTGPGYDNYPLNGETASDQYRSFARRDLRKLIQYAAAWTACKSKGWRSGNGQPLGLGDMSEENGDIPGTREGQPGHPSGTHVDGRDMDIAYFQKSAEDNHLRPICEHSSGGKDQYHCVKAPDDLDEWRSALVIGATVSTERVRVIGVDGKVGPILEKLSPALCKYKFLPKKACTLFTSVTYEETDKGRGWFAFHHHHWHISLNTSGASNLSGGSLDPENNAFGPELMSLAKIPGHAHIE